MPPANFQSLPVFPTSTSIDSVTTIRAALREFEGGSFARASTLCDAFGNDDRIKGVLDTRVEALFGLQREILPAGSEPAAVKLGALWDEMFPSAELKQFLRWGLLLRVAFGRWESTERAPGEWRYVFRNWDPRWCRYDWSTRSFWTLTDGNSEVQITPGQNGWVVYAPDGMQRGWMQGLVRSLALLYVSRRWAWRDWNRRSEVLGQTIKLAVVPANASEDDKKAFLESVRNIGGESVFRVARDENGQGFDVILREAVPGGEEGFRLLIDKSDECIAVDVLGQNLTTSMKGGGSYAAADVHDRIRVDRLEGDAQSLGPCLRDQAVRVWAEANYGNADLAPTLCWQTNTHVAVDPATGLNGAQVIALADVVSRVAHGELPRDTGVRMLVACFPLNEEAADKLMGEVGRGFKPAAPAVVLPKEDSETKDQKAPNED